MSTRKAFIGLSGPLAYDYKPLQANRRSSPNPILEDSLGLLTLYDELIFTSRELCPINMRKLPYVSFLSDRVEFQRTMPDVVTYAKKRCESGRHPNERFENPFDEYRPAVEAITGVSPPYDASRADFVTDNHGKLFSVGASIDVVGASARFENVVLDWLTVQAFNLEDCEIVSNSANKVFYDSHHADVELNVSRAALTRARIAAPAQLPWPNGAIS